MAFPFNRRIDGVICHACGDLIPVSKEGHLLNTEHFSQCEKHPVGRMKQALEAISKFGELEPMYAYCEKYEVSFNKQEPPYLTMAKIASNALEQLSAYLKRNPDQEGAQ